MLDISPNFSLPVDFVTSTCGILAKKGAGKSNAAVVMAEEMFRSGVPWVAIDPKGDWWGLRSSAHGNRPGLPIVVFGGLHGDVPLEATAGQMIADLVLEDRLTCVLDVSEFTKGETTRFLLAFAQRLYRKAKAEPLHLFLEEAHEYLPQLVRNDQAELVGAFQRIVKQGRFKGLGCTLITQRSASLNKDVLTQVDTLIVLRTTGPQDRNAVKAWVEQNDIDGELIASLPTLADGEAWVWTGDQQQRIQFRRRWTFDSGATPKVGEAPRAPATLADVDIDLLKTQMAETIERVKADDPKELRRRIAELERRPAQVERVEVRVPTVPDGLSAMLWAVNQAINDLRGVALADVDDWREQTRQLVAAGLASIEGGFPLEVTPVLPWSAPAGDRPVLAASATARPRGLPVSAPARTVEKPEAVQVDGLGVGEVRILTVICQHVGGVTKEQLTVLTGYKRSSRDTYLQRLRSKGLIHPGLPILPTQAGLETLGPDFEALPTGEPLRQHWLGNLTGGERAIFSELVSAWPNGVNRDILTDRTGYKRSSRDTYLQRLRARQLITTDGDPRATDILFQ